MQQKHSAGHGGPTTEDAEKSPDGVCLTDFGEESKFDGNFCKIEEKEKHPVVEQDGNVETFQNSLHSLASHISIEKEHESICDAAKPKDRESNFSLPPDHCAPLIDLHIIPQEMAPQRYEMSEHLSFPPALSTRRLIVDGQAMDVSSNFVSKPGDTNVDYGMEEEAQSVFSSLQKVEQSIQSLMEEQRSLSLSKIPSEIEEVDDPFLAPVSSDRSIELDKLEAAVERMLSEIEMQDATDSQIPLNIPPANVAMEDNLEQAFRETDSNSLQSETTPSFNADHFHSLVKHSLFEYPGEMTGYEHEFTPKPKLEEEELGLLSSRGEKFITDASFENDGMISGSRISQFPQSLGEGADVVKSQDTSRICEYGLSEASSGDLPPSKEINESKREEPRTVRAEVKLLVKTYDSGKEAIEIRSVREFVDTSRDQGGAFSGIFPLNFEGKTPQSQGSDPLKGTKIDYLVNSQFLDDNAPNPSPEASAEVDPLQEKAESSVEERGISPIIPDVALSAMKTTSVQRSVPLDTKTPELGTPAMSSSVTSTTTTTSDALVSDITAPESSKKTSSSPESPALSGLEAAALLTKVSTEQSPKKKDTDKGSSESTTAPTSSMAPQAFPFLSSTSTSADRALVEELTAGGIQAFEVESAFATKHPSSNLDQFETKTEDEVPDLLDDDLNSPEYTKSFIPTTPSKQCESSAKIPEDEPNKIIGEGHKDACSPEDKRARHILSDFESDTTSQPYVTTPTLQRRSFSRTIAGKIVRGSRPAPLEVVQLSNEDYDGENVTSEQHYTVTEPGDDDDNVDSKTDKWADSTCRVNSSPDLVSLTDPHPLQFIKTVNKDMQNLASFEADLGMGTSGSVEKIPTPQEEKKRPLFRIESSEDEGEIPSQYPSKEFDEQLFPLAEPSESVSAVDEKFERRVKKAERRFERIASKSLEEEERASVTGEDEVEETPSARERTREMEFQRMTSQLSTEELAGTEVDFQKVFTELLEEPSEEWDTHSHDLDTPERELDSILPEDDDPKGAVGITCSPPPPPPSEGSEFYQTQDPESTSEYDPSQTTTQARVVTTRTLTRTVMGEDGRPVSVTTTETEVSDGGSAEGVLDSNQLRESMQQIIDQFASGEETKEGKESKEEKKPE